VNLYSSNDLTINDDITNPTLKDSITNYMAYDCVDGQCKQTYGYIFNDDKIFRFKEGDSDGKGVVVDNVPVAAGVTEKSGCNDDNIGQFFMNHSAICIKHKMSVKFAPNPNTYIIMAGKYTSETLFSDTSDRVKGTDGYPVKVGKGYIMKDLFMDKGNLIKKMNI